MSSNQTIMPTPEEMNTEHDYLLWKDKDTLRNMTSKYNEAVSAFHTRIEQLEETADEVNQGTNQRFEDLNTELEEKFRQVGTELDSKIESVSKTDVGLGNVDNTSDMDKPVSTAQQQAIEQAIADFADEFTEEAPEGEIEGDDPQISSPIKQYIEDRVSEIEAAMGSIEYNIASDTRLGVVKSSDDIKVDPVTGKMSIPKLALCEEQYQSVMESLNSNNQVTQKVVDNQGTLENLQTENKSSLVSAINEVFQLGSEKKAKLVENLTAIGVTCSTDETWEVLLAKVLTVMTGFDTSDATMVTNQLLKGKTGYNSSGKVTGTMPNRAVSVTNGGDAESILHPSWSNQSLNHATLVQYDKYGPTTAELSDKLIFRTPEGYYDTNSRVYANPSEVAKAVGLTSAKLLKGNSVLGVTGTAEGVTPTYTEIERANSANRITQSRKIEFLNNSFDTFDVYYIEIYSNYDFDVNNNRDPLPMKICIPWVDLLINGTSITSGYKYFDISYQGTTYAKVYMGTEDFYVRLNSSAYGMLIYGASNVNYPR